MMQYILVGQTPVPEPDLMTWAKALESDRHVAITRVFDVAIVSTVFLGIDHNFCQLQGREPLLFETMVFWENEGGYEQDRCSTWRQAERMHARMVREVSRPQAFCAYLLRQARETVSQAWSELKEAIQRA